MTPLRLLSRSIQQAPALPPSSPSCCSAALICSPPPSTHLIPPSLHLGAPFVLLICFPPISSLHVIQGGLYLTRGAASLKGRGGCHDDNGLVAVPICSATVLMASTSDLFSLLYIQNPISRAICFSSPYHHCQGFYWFPPPPWSDILATGISETHFHTKMFPQTTALMVLTSKTYGFIVSLYQKSQISQFVFNIM